MNTVVRLRRGPGHVIAFAGFSMVWIPLLLLVLWAALLLSDDDVRRAYPSPERHAGVREWKLSGPLPPPDLRREAGGDFDGDGVLDVLTLEYFHMEPLHRPTTSGMVYVRCGRTGEVLLAHAVASPISGYLWAGDVDGNGTDDVLVKSRGTWSVLGFRDRRAPRGSR